LVEFFSGIVFVLIFIFFPPVTLITSIKTFLLIVMSCLLTVITIYAIRHKIIPDSMSYSFSILAFVYMFIGQETIFHLPSTINLLAGPILSLPFALLWLVSKGNWIGLGDAKIEYRSCQ
jgi:Flp pilus assembly protein protease CpaA